MTLSAALCALGGCGGDGESDSGDPAGGGPALPSTPPWFAPTAPAFPS